MNGQIPNEQAVAGLTVRDYFAAAAVGPLMASDGYEKRFVTDLNFPITDLPKITAELAYEIADAMLAKRAKRPGGEVAS